MSVKSTKNTLDRLWGLVSAAEAGGEPDIQAIVASIHELRKLCGATGALYASREQAAARRKINVLFDEASRHLNDYHYEGKDVRHFREAATKAAAACQLREEADAAAAEAPAAPTDASYELLGNILIVGWW